MPRRSTPGRATTGAGGGLLWVEPAQVGWDDKCTRRITRQHSVSTTTAREVEPVHHPEDERADDQRCVVQRRDVEELSQRLHRSARP